MSQTSSPNSKTKIKKKLKASKKNKVLQTPSLDIKISEGTTLRTQLLQTLLPAALIPLVVIGIFGYVNIRQKEITRVKEELKDQALLTGEIALQTINEADKIPATLANNPLIIQAINNTTNQINAENLLASPLPQLESKYQKDKLIVVDATINNYLKKTANDAGLNSLLLTQSNGFNVAYSNSVNRLNHKEETWWQEAKNKNRSVNSIANNYGLSLAQAIKDPNSGAFLGVIQGFLPATRFTIISDYLRKAGLSGSQIIQVFVPNSEQEILTLSTAETKTNQPILGSEEIIKLAQAMITTVADVNLITEMNLAEFKSESSIKPQFTPIYEQNGEEILIASFAYQNRQYTLATIPRTSWVVSTSMDIKDINQAGSGVIGLFASAVILLLIAVTIILFILSKRLSQPLNQLSTVAAKVATGDLAIEAQLLGTRETKTLAQSFNELLTRVRNLLVTQEKATNRALLLAEISNSGAKDEESKFLFFNQALEKIKQQLKVDRVVIYKFNPDWSGYISHESLAENWPSAMREIFNDTCISQEFIQAYQDGRIVAYDDVFNSGFHPEHLALMERLEIKSNLVVPMIGQNGLFALLIAHHCAEKHNWQSDEINLMQDVAIQLQIIQDRVSFLQQIQQTSQKAEKLAQEQQELKDKIQKRALQLLMEVQPLSQGDLTIRATVSEDEIGTLADSYNATIESLNKIVTQVQKTSEKVSNATNLNEISIQDLKVLSQQQQEEMSTALDKLESMSRAIVAVTNNAKNAQTTVQQANQTIKKGDEVMNLTVEGILTISDTVSSTAEKVKALGESFQKISKVVKLISNFANQTNLLALNAAIEAARAGEQGRGFAVVAEEVGLLASQSAQATTEIIDLVEGIQRETKDVVQAMEEGTEEVLQGTFLVEEARDLLNQISQASIKTNELVGEITVAALQQFEDSEIVIKTMDDVSEITKKTFLSSQNMAGSFDELLIISQELKDTVSQFKV